MVGHGGLQQFGPEEYGFGQVGQWKGDVVAGRDLVTSDMLCIIGLRMQTNVHFLTTKPSAVAYFRCRLFTPRQRTQLKSSFPKNTHPKWCQEETVEDRIHLIEYFNWYD